MSPLEGKIKGYGVPGAWLVFRTKLMKGCQCALHRIRSRSRTGRDMLWHMRSATTLLVLLAVAICATARPDFESIASYRIETPLPAKEQPFATVSTNEEAMLYLPSYGGVIDIYIGDNVPVRLPEDREAGLTHERKFGVLVIPAGQEGTPIRLVQHGDSSLIGIGPVYLGPRDSIGPIVKEHRVIGRAMQLVLPGTGLLLLALSSLLIFFSRQPLKYLVLIPAILLQLLIELSDEPLMAGIAIEPWIPAISASANFLISLSITFWLEASAQTRKRLATLSVGLVVYLLLIAFAHLQNHLVVEGLTALLFIGWIVWLQLFNLRLILLARTLNGKVRGATLAVLILSSSGLVAYQVLVVARPGIELTFFLSNWVNVAAGGGVLAFGMGSLASEILAYRRQRQHLALLDDMVAGHHLALDDKILSLRREIERGAVLVERERFLRDMHDGLGGQLLSLLLRLRKADGEVSDLANDVQTIIADLRLIASALDEEGVSLAAALARLHTRMTALCSSSGLELSWIVDLDGLPDLTTGNILHVVKIVEEAMTNAIRHAGASRLEISVTVSGALVIQVTDNGRGFDPEEITPGCGLVSIRHRATQLRGVLTISKACRSDADVVRPGSCVRVAVPVAAPVSGYA